MTQPVTVYKRDHRGRPVWSYTGTLVDTGYRWVCLQADFQRDAVDIGVMVFERGDRMTEWFYSDRYYNVFRVQHGYSLRLKGWYCNITRPAEITPHSVASDDLALDVFVSPDGKITLLDEDEFAALPLPPDERVAALQAVESIQRLAALHEYPFHPPWFFLNRI
jgi:uncharacterized protein